MLAVTSNAIFSQLWPLGVIGDELIKRRDQLLSSLEGSVLVLGGPVIGTAEETTKIRNRADKFDHVCSIGWLGAIDNVEAGLAALIERLSPDGYLHSIDPTLGFGMEARLVQFAGQFGYKNSGWWYNRDIPAALRAAGLLVTDVDRFEMPARIPLGRSWAQSRARFPLATPFDTPR